ncbi:MAG: 4Fe-4S binding protein [Brevinema sp.]
MSTDKHPFEPTRLIKPEMKSKKKYSVLQICRYVVMTGFFVFFVFFNFLDFRWLPASLLVMTIFGGAFFCGWICPMGFLQDLSGLIARRFGIKQKNMLPRKFHLAMTTLRYILFFCVVFGVVFSFTYLAYADGRRAVHTFAALRVPHLIACIILLILLTLSVFYKRIFCSYLCVEGAKQALLSSGRVFSIIRNPDSCIDCKKCDQACPMNIKVSRCGNLQSMQCVNCFQCVSSCPVKNTLSYGPIRPVHDPVGRFLGKEKLQQKPLFRYGVIGLRLAVVVAFFAFWLYGPGKITAYPHFGRSATFNWSVPPSSPIIDEESSASDQTDYKDGDSGASAYKDEESGASKDTSKTGASTYTESETGASIPQDADTP